MDAPPKFRFKVVSSLRYALSRQLSEAVRIELRGEDILSSKSEFNICKVPRLKIDLEKVERDWKVSWRTELEIAKEVSLADMEDSARRDDTKRKADGTEKVRKSKERKLEKLVNWGMEEDVDSVEQAEETTGVTDLIVNKQLTLATKDWLLTPISTKPWTMNLRQATLNIQRMTPCQTAGKSIQLVPPPDPVHTDGWKVKIQPEVAWKSLPRL